MFTTDMASLVDNDYYLRSYFLSSWLHHINFMASLFAIGYLQPLILSEWLLHADYRYGQFIKNHSFSQDGGFILTIHIVSLT